MFIQYNWELSRNKNMTAKNLKQYQRNLKETATQQKSWEQRDDTSKNK